MKGPAPEAKANLITFPKCWGGESFNISPSFWGCFCMFYWSSCSLMSLHPLTPHPSSIQRPLFLSIYWSRGAVRWLSAVAGGLPCPWPHFLLAGCVGMSHAPSPALITCPGGLESPLLPCEIWAVRVQGLPVCPIRSATEGCFWRFPQFEAEDSQPWRQVVCSENFESSREVCLNIWTGYLLLTYF